MGEGAESETPNYDAPATRPCLGTEITTSPGHPVAPGTVVDYQNTRTDNPVSSSTDTGPNCGGQFATGALLDAQH